MSVHASTWVWERSRAEKGTLVVALVLADCAHGDGRGIYPSQAEIARRSRLTDRQVRNCLRQLEQWGEIVNVGKTKVGTAVWDMPGVRDDPEIFAARNGDSTRKPTSAQTGNPLPTNRKRTVIESSPDGEDVALFDFWRETFGLNGNAKFTAKRRRKIRDRLDEGYSIEFLRNAIVGCRRSSFHVAHNHIDLELICRDGEHVERFERIAREGDGPVDSHAPPTDLSKYRGLTNN